MIEAGVAMGGVPGTEHELEASFAFCLISIKLQMSRDQLEISPSTFLSLAQSPGSDVMGL